ncbi:succinate dehydrogenase/fumarate reductase iron-sulfur subunit [Methanobrevibacter sp. TMH8]|uniref:fumarate reductase (CoM/CoB) subunit TfrB n=1 Tax=Methanobrevibacter sp. TMH8 TaxID=2848611 RepID=UPI001CCF7BF4|nr:fumarate reductase (CoM/CoB) subunit TfrB [Methanobrevibacter sp. TMH8]MBZ9571678.1 succinate dehydrogenase/fumarate reductase iron-sulfur subunit [Methanobrevibacter sp. TMH8]
MIEIKVLRFDREKDEKPYFEKYEIEKTYKMKVLDALMAINDKYNANISFRSSCRAGQCGSCALKMNGEVVLACKAEIEDYSVIEPLDFPVIKDLIVDKSEIEEKVAKMQLFLEANSNKKSQDINVEVDNIQIKGCDCPSIIENEECVDTKKVRSCIECYSCLSACPVIKETDEFAGPYFMRYLSKFDFDPRDAGNRTEESINEGLYYCTSCGKCGQVCPKEINSFGDAIEKLRALANNKNLGPLEAHKEVKKMISATGRSVEPLQESFIEAVNKKKKNKSESKDKSKIAVFTGCMVDYRLQNVGFALIDVLEKNGFEVDIPKNQVCCGSPMLRTGQTNIVNDLIEKNNNALSEYDTIITVCAGCGATLKKDYPKYGVNLNVLDISEFLADKLDTNQMKDLNMRVTYHDPCHLIRGQGISEEPREILNKIKGLEFIEMEKPDQCCGAGGGVRAGKPEIAFGLGKKKADMIKKLDVDAVVSICPFCQYNIQDALDKEGLKNIKVINILELLKMAYDIE